MKKYVAIVITVMLSIAPFAFADEERLLLDPQETKIAFTLDSTLHMVHGTMVLESGLIIFDLDTGQASGSIVLDAVKTETGNAKRDKKMHNKVLETPKFPKIIFTPKRVTRTKGSPGNETINLHGEVLIHGTAHQLTLIAKTERHGDSLSGTCTFKVPFVDWNMEDPSVFVFRTDKHVDVSLDIHGTISSGSPE